MTKKLNELDLKPSPEKEEELNGIFDNLRSAISTYAYTLNECEEKQKLMKLLEEWDSIELFCSK